MTQAAAEGIIDFSAARPFDPSWHRHVALLLAYTARRNNTELLRGRMQHYWNNLLEYHLNRLSKGQSDYPKKVREAIEELNVSLEQSLRPWQKVAVQQRVSEVKQAISTWEQLHGSLQSSVTQEAVDRTAAALLASIQTPDKLAAKEGSRRARTRQHFRRPARGTRR